MHQRSRVVRAVVSGAIGLLLVAGCLPAPNRVTAASLGREGVVKQTLPRGNSGSPVLVTAGQNPASSTTPLPPPTILSNNGANILRGAVRAPASIISHNGGNIVSNNGGSIVSNNGGSIISHNGGNVISNNGSNLQIAQVPLAYTTVRLKDAAGNSVKDDQGKELVTKTDAEGNYSFPVDVKGRNLVVEADVDGQTGKLKSFLPKDGLQAGTGLDVDLTSTLTLAYILDQYVKGDLATFERLPKDIEGKARTVTETAIVQKGIELPSSLEGGAIVAKVDEVRRADSTVDQVFEDIKRLLVVVGITNEGDGLQATDVDPGIIGGVLAEPSGALYVFSQYSHTLWRLTTDGVLHTLVPKGNWGYSEQTPQWFNPGYNSGIARDGVGNIYMADTYNNRVVKVDPGNHVTIIAGTGTAGFSGDGASAKLAQLNKPSGLALDLVGNIYVSDTENNRVRRIRPDGVIQTVVGDGTPGYSGDGGPGNSARVNRPQGIAISASGDIYVADYENAHIRVVSADGKIRTFAAQADPIPSPIALAINDQGEVLCSSHRGDAVYRVTSTGVSMIVAPTTAVGHVDLSFPRTLAVSPKRLIIDVNGTMLVALDEQYTATRLLGLNAATESSQVRLLGAYKMAIDKNGSIFISDMGAKEILRAEPNGDLGVVAGNGETTTINFISNPVGSGIGIPAGIAIDADGGILFTTIGGYTSVRQLTFNRGVSTVAGSGHVDYSIPPTGPALGIDLPNPYDVSKFPDGRVVFTIPEENCVMQLDRDGALSHFVPPGQSMFPYYMAQRADGSLAITELTGKKISLYTNGTQKTVLSEKDVETYMRFSDVKAICYDQHDNLYVASSSLVVRWDTSGKLTLVAGAGAKYLSGNTKDDGLSAVTDIEFAPSGELYILETTQLKRLSTSQVSSL